MGAVGVRKVFALLVGATACAAALSALLSVSACVKFSPEVKQTFEPQSAKEHSNFEPRTPPYGPIYVGPVPGQRAADASADVVVVDEASPPIELDAGPPPIPSEAGVL
jgi:hypothetical protein